MNYLHPITGEKATTKQKAKAFVDQAKELLKTETSPQKRLELAIWGEEMNKLWLKLSSLPPRPVCERCGLEKPEEDFGMVKSINHYTTKKGKKRCYVSVARRRICNACMWPKEKHFKK